MKRAITFPTIIALVLIALFLGVGVLLVQRQQFITSTAQESTPIPQNITISNVTDQSFTVSWVTDSETVGFVKAGMAGEQLSRRVSDDRDKDVASAQATLTHYATVDNLNADTAYDFQIGQGTNSLYGQNGQPFSQKTAPTLPNSPSPDTAQGVVRMPSSEPAAGAIVYARLSGAQLISALVSSSGNWIIPLSTLRRSDLADWASYDVNSTVYSLFVEAGKMGRAEAVLTTALDRPAPPIVLGKSYDFRQYRESLAETETSGQSTVPSEEDESLLTTDTYSLFDFSFIGPVTPLASDITLDNPSREKEVIYTDRPEFFGKGPRQIQLEIVVESPQTISGEATVLEDGVWRYTALESLSVGQHTITIRWTDIEGISRSLRRSFIVSALEQPAFTATPSATPTLEPTAIPTLEPTATPTVPPRTTQPSTDSGTLQPGNQLPTMLLVTIGLFLTVFGAVIMQRSYGR